MGKDLRGKEIGKGLSQRKNKKYQARFLTKKGNRLSKQFDKLNEAKKWLADMQYEDEHNSVVSSDMTVDAWFEFWIENLVEPCVKYNTTRSYRTRYASTIQPIIGQMLMSEIRPMDCQRVLTAAKNRGNASSTIGKIYVAMKKMFEDAVENLIIESNPITRSVRYEKLKSDEKTILTLEQQRMFERLCKKHRFGLDYLFVLHTGLRYSELAALRWQDIDWGNRLINVCGAIYYDYEEKEYFVNPPKTASGYRAIPITDITHDILIKRRELVKNSKIMPIKGSGFVFINMLSGKPVSNALYNKHLKKIAEEINVPKLSIHLLRHTFATRCIENGMSPKILQSILGHSNISMTMDLYVHATEDEKVKEMLAMEKRLNLA